MGETFGFRVPHVHPPCSGILIALAANSASGADDQPSTLIVSVYQTLENTATAPGARAGFGLGLGLESDIAHPAN